MSVDTVPLGDVLELRRRQVQVEPDVRYTEIGLRSFGRGVFHKDPVSGQELGGKRVFHIHPGDLLVSNVFGWEGAVAVAGSEESGLIGSHRFMTWTPVDAAVDVRYAKHYLLSDAGIESLRRASPGSAGRNRTLNKSKFEAIRIPLPSIEDQRRIIMRLNIVTQFVADIKARQSEGVSDAVVLLPGMVQKVIDDAALPYRLVSDMASMVSDTVRPGDNLGRATEFVGLEHIKSHTGRRVGGRVVGAENGRKQRFQPGDIVFGYLRPYLNKVWVADCHGLCSVEQFILRPHPDVDPMLLAAALRGRRTLDKVIATTNSLQLPRLGSRQLLGLNLPDCRQSSSGLRARIETVEACVVELAAAEVRRAKTLAALLPAARNEVFSRLG